MCWELWVLMILALISVALLALAFIGIALRINTLEKWHEQLKDRNDLHAAE